MNIELIKIDKRDIKSLEINYAAYDTVYGVTVVASTDQGICFVGFVDLDWSVTSLQERYPGAQLQEKEMPMHQLALQFITTGSIDEPLVLHIPGTDFQFKVWEELLRIPIGEVTTYMTIAQAIDNPKAVRAVGSAVGSNHISYIIPCHRVVRSDGGMGGYFWGVELKEQMLAREKAIKE